MKTAIDPRVQLLTANNIVAFMARFNDLRDARVDEVGSSVEQQLQITLMAVDKAEPSLNDDEPEVAALTLHFISKVESNLSDKSVGRIIRLATWKFEESLVCATFSFHAAEPSEQTGGSLVSIAAEQAGWDDEIVDEDEDEDKDEDETLLHEYLYMYWHPNHRGRGWPNNFRTGLKQLNDPTIAQQFKLELAAALSSDTYGPSEFNAATDLGSKTRDEVVEELREVWQTLYGHESL